MLEIFRNRRVVVTGHTGFKGSWLTAWLKRLGANVFGISLRPHTEPSHFVAANIGDGIDNFFMDICDQDALTDAIGKAKPDFLFHLAAQAIVGQSYRDPVETWRTNVFGTLNVLEALRKLETPCVAVIITSDKCYNNVEWVWGYRETDALGGPDPYSASKGAAELLINSYSKSFFAPEGNIKVVSARAGNVIGGGDWAPGRIVPDCVRAWSNHKSVSLRNPHSTRPWQHVLEPLSGYLWLAAEVWRRGAPLHGEAFNFGPTVDQTYSVLDLVQEMSKHWEDVAWNEVSVTSGEPHEAGLLKLACDKAMHHLKWRSVLAFQETVLFTAQWYDSFYKSPPTIAETTYSQIGAYCALARERGLKWAQ